MRTSLDRISDYRKLGDRLDLPRPLVLACGCFDLLTPGHTRHLREARTFGLALCVLVTADQYVCKGPGRPVLNADERAEVVDAVRWVDFTIVNPYPTAAEAIRLLKPEVYAKGREYRSRPSTYLEAELQELLEVGGRLVFTETEEFHTTEVIDRIGAVK